jgi:hypothetical protein
MRKPGWVLAGFAFTAALVAAGCQPSSTGDASKPGAPAAGQSTAARPDGLQTVVLNAKGMH